MKKSKCEDNREGQRERDCVRERDRGEKREKGRKRNESRGQKNKELLLEASTIELKFELKLHF